MPVALEVVAGEWDRKRKVSSDSVSEKRNEIEGSRSKSGKNSGIKLENRLSNRNGNHSGRNPRNTEGKEMKNDFSFSYTNSVLVPPEYRMEGE